MSNGTIAGIPGGPEAYRQASIAATLDALFENTVSYVRDRIDWYIRNSRNRARKKPLATDLTHVVEVKDDDRGREL